MGGNVDSLFWLRYMFNLVGETLARKRFESIYLPAQPQCTFLLVKHHSLDIRSLGRVEPRQRVQKSPNADNVQTRSPQDGKHLKPRCQKLQVILVRTSIAVFVQCSAYTKLDHLIHMLDVCNNILRPVLRSTGSQVILRDLI